MDARVLSITLIFLGLVLLSGCFDEKMSREFVGGGSTLTQQLIEKPSTMTIEVQMEGIKEDDLDYVSVIVSDAATSKIVGTYFVDNQTGKAQIPLAKGNYEISVNAPAKIYVQEN